MLRVDEWEKNSRDCYDGGFGEKKENIRIEGSLTYWTGSCRKSQWPERAQKKTSFDFPIRSSWKKKHNRERIKDENSARCSRTYKIYDEHKNGMRERERLLELSSIVRVAFVPTSSHNSSQSTVVSEVMCSRWWKRIKGNTFIVLVKQWSNKYALYKYLISLLWAHA